MAGAGSGPSALAAGAEPTANPRDAGGADPAPSLGHPGTAAWPGLWQPRRGTGSTFLHELGDDVDGLLLGDDRVQLHQLVMLQCLHQVRLFQEGIHGHAAWLHRLHRHLGVLVISSCGVTQQTIPSLPRAQALGALYFGAKAPTPAD